MLNIEFINDIPAIEKEQVYQKKAGPVNYIGVVSRFSPSLLYKGYQPLIDYLNENTEYHFELRLNKTYQDAVTQLATGELQAAFLGTYVFISNLDKFPIYTFLAPLNNDGLPHFQSVLISREDYEYKSLIDVAGKKIGVPSPSSFSGNWLQEIILPTTAINKSELPQFINFDFHHTVVLHVIRGDLQMGVVKDRVADEYLGKGIKILEKSLFIPASPLVRGENSSESVITAMKIVLTAIDPKNAQFLINWDPEFHNGFSVVDNSPYEVFKKTLKKKRYQNGN